MTILTILYNEDAAKLGKLLQKIFQIFSHYLQAIHTTSCISPIHLVISRKYWVHLEVVLYEQAG